MLGLWHSAGRSVCMQAVSVRGKGKCQARQPLSDPGGNCSFVGNRCLHVSAVELI